MALLVFLSSFHRSEFARRAKKNPFGECGVVGGLKRMEGSSTELLSGGNILAEYMLAQYGLSGIIRMGILTSVLKSCPYTGYSRHLTKYITFAIVFTLY